VDDEMEIVVGGDERVGLSRLDDQDAACPELDRLALDPDRRRAAVPRATR
jgi:hypothetical protein